MEITGRLVEVLEPVTGQGKNGPWKKQEVVLETPGQYPKKVCIAMWGDKINDSILQVGNELTAQIDVESREYNGRWYTEVKAWKMESASQQAPQGSDVPPPPPADFVMPEEEGDALPF